jgi:hypothetical protein
MISLLLLQILVFTFCSYRYYPRFDFGDAHSDWRHFHERFLLDEQAAANVRRRHVRRQNRSALELQENKHRLKQTKQKLKIQIQIQSNRTERAIINKTKTNAKKSVLF